MKKTAVLIPIFVAGSLSMTMAQEQETRPDTTDTTRRLPDNANNATFRDDSTDATVSNSNLSGSAGTAAASGTGGQGAVQNPGRNTSSDIYNIERRDSIERAKQDSISRESKRSKRTGK